MAKILIVEDNYDTAKMLEKRVSDWGFDAMLAYDTDSAIALVSREKPDLVLLDLMLPAGGGELVLSKIRTSPATKGTPVIVISAITDEECMRTVEKMGISAYIQKPYEPDKLLATIREALAEGGKKA